MHSKGKLKKAPARGSVPLPSGVPPSGEELLHFFDQSFDLLCIAGFDGIFKHLNPAWQQILGWTPAELQSRPFLDFVHPDDRPATLAEMTKLATGAVTINFENRYQCNDGAWKWLQWTAKHSPVSRSIYAIARDVTVQRRMEKAILDTLDQERERMGRELHDGHCQDLAAIAAMSVTLARGNVANGDGCSSTCTAEPGYVCTGSPSVCTPTCGDGIQVGTETCDQGGGNVANGDGCSSSCTVEPGYSCTGSPSVCVLLPFCGSHPDGTTCDDGSAATPTDICSGGSCVQCVPNGSASPRFVDNGLTVTDLATCLVWEKKTSDGSMHDVNNSYTWCDATGDRTGICSGYSGNWIADVNAEVFAGHNDWRVPSDDGRNPPYTGPQELESIVDTSYYPTIDPIFGPTIDWGYWSSSTQFGYPDDALDTYFEGFGGYFDLKSNFIYVRAVRGGS